MEKKTLSIIEFDYHAEVLMNSLKILSYLTDYKILLFVSKKVWQQIEPSIIPNNTIEVNIAKNSKEIKTLIKSRLHDINNSQAIFFNTLASNFRFFYSVNFIPPVILRIHNSNTYFNAFRSINPKLTPYFIWKDMSYLILHALLKLDTIYRSKFVRDKVSFFQFPSSITAEYALKNKYLTPNMIFPTVPYVFMKELVSVEKSENTTNIAILGGIDKRRRNYTEVLNAFSALVPELKTPVTLSLVGKPSGNYGAKIIRSFNKLESKFFKINTFSSFVPQQVFNEITSNADFLIIPTVKETKYKLYKELYGFTKISGSINDMIVYQKPAIVPSFYPLEKSLQNHTESYHDTKSLVVVLKKWVNDTEYKKYEIRNIIEEYSFETIIQHTREGLQKIVK